MSHHHRQDDGIHDKGRRSEEGKATGTDGGAPLPRYCHICISVAGATPRRIVIELHRDVCPRTCRNFVNICSSDAVAVRPKRRPPSSSSATSSSIRPTYRNTEFHRVVPGFMVQGGDYENFDGSGGSSSFGGTTFPDENFVVKHDAEGVVSMANRGKDTNGSQFFITLGRASHLDGKHVAFGKVVEGMDVVRDMGSVETDERDRPVVMQRIVVVDCGVGRGDDDDDGERGSSEGRVVPDASGRSEGKSSSSNKKRKKRKKKEKRRRRHRSRSISGSNGSDSDSLVESDSDCHDHDRRDGRRRRSKSRSRSKHRRRGGRKREKSSSRRRGSDDESSSSSSSSGSEERHRGRKSRRKKRSRDPSRGEGGRRRDR